MRPILCVVLLLVAAGCDRGTVVLEPEEIDVCPVLADQLEDLLEAIVEFAEGATIDDLDSTTGEAAQLRRRGVDLSERAVALGCDPAALRSEVSVSDLESDDPVAGLFIELVLESLG